MRPPAAPTFALSRPARASRPGGALASLLFHVAIILLLAYPATQFLKVRDPGDNPYSQSGGGGGGGGGSDALAYISLPATRPPPPVEEPFVTPVETPQVPVAPEPAPVDTVDHSTVAQVDSAAQAGDGLQGAPSPGSGGGTGGGNGPGDGPGTGPGSGPGNGGSGGATAPQIKQFILTPPDPPRGLKGQTITVTFSVRADGRVDHVEFQPEIQNRDYANKFRESLLGFRFVPALSAAGVPIAGEYPISVCF
jgi:hypothetical protein